MSRLHEPEPWRIELNHPPLEYVLLKDTIVIGTADGDCGVCLVSKLNPANAERIVACVNACAGMNEPEAEIERLREHNARLVAMMPLFTEARDALPAISLASAKLHGVRLDLASRMDDIGSPDLWKERYAAMRKASKA